MRKYIISQQGQELGPFSEEEIKQKIMIHQLQPVDYLYDEEQQDWVLIMEKFDLQIAQQDPKSWPQDPPQDLLEKSQNTDIYPQLPPHLENKNQEQTITPSHHHIFVSEVAPSSDYNQIKFDSGIGTLELKQVQAGQVHVRFKECTENKISLPNEAIIQVAPAPARTLEWNLPTKAQAGDPFPIKIIARDSFGNFTPNFTGTVELYIDSQESTRHALSFTHGQAEWNFTPILAAPFCLELKDRFQLGLKLPNPQYIEVLPGEVARFILESPPQAVAGETLPLTLKAVDSHGNLVADFKGEIGIKISLEAKKHENTEPTASTVTPLPPAVSLPHEPKNIKLSRFTFKPTQAPQGKRIKPFD